MNKSDDRYEFRGVKIAHELMVDILGGLIPGALFLFNIILYFTFIDDIVEGVVRIAQVVPTGNKEWDDTVPDPASSSAPYRIYNIGSSCPTKLMDYINCIEKAIGREARKEFLPMQPGDVYQTYADSSALAEVTGFSPNTSLDEGIRKTVEWIKGYYTL